MWPECGELRHSKTPFEVQNCPRLEAEFIVMQEAKGDGFSDSNVMLETCIGLATARRFGAFR
jgi:hypothetical protein